MNEFDVYHVSNILIELTPIQLTLEEAEHCNGTLT